MTRRVRVPMLIVLVAMALSLSGCSSVCQSYCEKNYLSTVGAEEEPVTILVRKIDNNFEIDVSQETVVLEYDATQPRPSQIVWGLQLDAAAQAVVKDVAIQFASVTPTQAGSIFVTGLGMTPQRRRQPSGPLRAGMVFDGNGEVHAKYDVVVTFNDGHQQKLDPKIIIRR